MALDPKQLQTPGTPEFWMQLLARKLLDPRRTLRLGTLEAYRAGVPPITYLAPSEHKGFYAFHRLSRTNLARKVVSSLSDGMSVRSIRTAAADDSSGDAVAWRYWTANALDVQSKDVHNDMLTFAEGYVRVGIDRSTGRPMALRRDPRFTVTAQDPLNPQRTVAAFELVWDEYSHTDYAYLWLHGEQWVASRPRKMRPSPMGIPGITTVDARRFGWFWPRLSFDPAAFTMRPFRPTSAAEADGFVDDGGPYSESYDADVMPMVLFSNRDGIGEFEEHLDLIDRIIHTILQRVVIAAIQAYKQRALKQPAEGPDRLPDTNPETGQKIDWDEVFEPGPDALWKLPPGVEIWESTETQLLPIIAAATQDIKHLSAVTDTPMPLLSDDTNSSADASQARREGRVAKVEDRDMIAGRGWARVLSLMFALAPDEDRYAGDGDQRVDRADGGQIVIDWAPAERFSLSERAQADAQNKSLSPDMAAAKIWGLTPDEVSINRAQRAADVLMQPAAPVARGGSAA